MCLNCTRNWKIRIISFVQTNGAFAKLKCFLWKIRADSRGRKVGDAELNSLSNCHKFRLRICVSTAQETGKYGKWNWCWRILLWENENFSYKKFVVKVKEGEKEMQNWILFQSVTNWDREFGSQLHKKLKNMENFIGADEFIYHKIRIFLFKNSCWK